MRKRFILDAEVPTLYFAGRKDAKKYLRDVVFSSAHLENPPMTRKGKLSATKETNIMKVAGSQNGRH